MMALDVFGRRLKVILLATLAATALGGGATADAAGSVETVRWGAQDKAKSIERQPIVFYVATGSADACGPGCNKWIAAEGRIDREAAGRLHLFLRNLPDRKPPIYFLSRGGDIRQAVAIGRLMRKYKLKAGVARTLPVGCRTETTMDQSACDELKRSGKPLEAGFRTSRAYCLSACVYAFVGASVREVGSNARLGVHASRVYLRRPPKGRQHARRVLSRLKGTLTSELLAYFREVGISSELYRIANGVPHKSMRVLTLKEIARLKIAEVPGLELARFSAADTVKNLSGAVGMAATGPVVLAPEWKLQVSRAGPAAVSIVVADAHGVPQAVSLRIVCAGPGMTKVSLSRKRDPHDAGVAYPITLTARNGRYLFPPGGHETPVQDGRRLDERLAFVPTKFFESPGSSILVLTDAVGENPGKERPESQAVATIMIPTEGLVTSFTALQQRCHEFPPLGAATSNASGLPD